MRIPARAEAERLLKEAEARNPGPWADHSRTAGTVAMIIAARCEGMDAETAYALGLLHDIGRREGWTHIAHTLDGYRYLCELGYDDAARICLTHSFPIPDVHTYHGTIDCPEEDVAFLQASLTERPYDAYDELIQLCDAISLPHGPVLMEKRLVDVVLRHGMPEWTLTKWRAFFALKARFDERLGCDLYSLLPDVVHNTFAAPQA